MGSQTDSVASQRGRKEEEVLVPCVTAPVISQTECWTTLEEAVSLVRSNSRTQEQNRKLHHLLATCFQAESMTSLTFRSITCHNIAGVGVSLEQFNEFVVQPHSDYEFRLGCPSQTCLPLQLLKIDNIATCDINSLEHAHSKVVFVLDHFQHKRTDEINSYRHRTLPNTWLNAILGLEGKCTKLLAGVPPLPEIHSRIECSIHASFLEKEASKTSRQPFFSRSSGSAWKPTAPSAKTEIDYDKLELVAMSKFPAYLNQFLEDRGKYIDELAGVDVPYYVQEVADRFSALVAKAPKRRVEAVHLKRRAASNDDEVGGTVVAIHQYLSPSFLAYFTTDQDSCAYMDDIRSKHKKDRKIRVSSSDHLNSNPVWVMFGKGSDPYLYLSQKASGGEQLWLKIVNYVMGLLESFVNLQVRFEVRQSGGLFQSQPEKDKVYHVPRYATNVAVCGDPLVSLFGRHTDLRPGLDSEAEPRFRQDNLLVPTGCMQNHCRSITTITWYPKEEPSHQAGSVTQEQNLIHLQLKSVQVHWEHAVRSSCASWSV
jgi:hypothetical protein